MSEDYAMPWSGQTILDPRTGERVRIPLAPVPKPKPNPNPQVVKDELPVVPRYPRFDPSNDEDGA